MQFLVLFLLVAVMSFRYLVSEGLLPQVMNYVPEILSLAACVAVVVVGVQTRFKYVRPIYWLVFGAIGVVVVCGVVVNAVGSGPLFAGMRTYLRALPFFFLPAVVAFSERQVRTQLLLLLAFCSVQLPISWTQRMGTLSAGGHTGDYTFGTLMDSGVQSMFLISAACVLTGAYLRRRVSLTGYAFFLLLILLPTTLNETKATLVMLPIGLLVTFYAGSARGARLKNTLVGLAVIGGFGAIFVPVYDYFIMLQGPNYAPYRILSFVSSDKAVENYLSKGTKIGEKSESGRFDGIAVGFQELSQDPAKLIFGFGIGNASESALGPQFRGAQYARFAQFPPTTLRDLLLEVGILGLGFVLLFHCLVFSDSLAVARRDPGLMGTLAMGWTGIGALIFMSFPYTTLNTDLMSYVYWYFSGLIAATRMRALAGKESPTGPIYEEVVLRRSSV